MTPAALLSDLSARGVEFEIAGDRLRFRPTELLKPGEIKAVRLHKDVILKLLRSELREAAPIKPWPIVAGTEHFSLWIDDPSGPLPEFIPGYHYDVRQPSRLRPLCQPVEVEQ